MKISVIVPVFNAVLTLQRCVDSILNNTYSNFELILINDGSSDASLDICNFYALEDKRVVVIDKENGGAGSARNLGLERASGSWVTFCDSDDYVEPQWLENFVANTNGVSVVMQGFRPDGNEMDGKTSFSYDGNKYDGLLNLYKYPMPGSLCTKCLDKSVIDKFNIRFNEDFKFREDEDFLLRYILNIDYIRAIEYCGYNYMMPIFDEKYKQIDAFYPFISIYNSLDMALSMSKCYILNLYRKELVFSVCHSYETNDIQKKSKLYLLMDTLGNTIITHQELSLWVRIVLGVIRPKPLVHWIMNFTFKVRGIKYFKSNE